MDKYLIRIIKYFDVNTLKGLGEITYYDSLNNILFLKTNLRRDDIMKIDGVISVEESRVFKIGI